jgi:hypothetical protein
MILEEEDLTIAPRVPDVSRIDADIEDENDQEDEDRHEREPTIATIDSADEDEHIDMSRDPLYRQILLGITDEDLLNVQGKQINKPTPTSIKTEAIPRKSVKFDEKSVHHYCIQMIDEKDMMSKEVRSITQLYHQRARFRHQLPFSTTYHKHGQLPKFPIKQSFEEEEEEEEQKM